MTEHTQGSLNAANIIMGDDEWIFTAYGRKRLEGLAALIDNQTKTPELLTTVKELVGALELACTITARIEGTDYLRDGEADELRTAIKRANDGPE